MSHNGEPSHKIVFEVGCLSHCGVIGNSGSVVRPCIDPVGCFIGSEGIDCHSFLGLAINVEVWLYAPFISEGDRISQMQFIPASGSQHLLLWHTKIVVVLYHFV